MNYYWSEMMLNKGNVLVCGPPFGSHVGSSSLFGCVENSIISDPYNKYKVVFHI